MVSRNASLATTIFAGALAAAVAHTAFAQEGAAPAAGADASHYCANNCKGKSACKGHGNDNCSGQNACKGKGFLSAADKDACKKAGGMWKKAKK